METLEYDHEIFSAAQRESDRNLAVRFYMLPVRNEQRTVEEGRPIFEDTEHVEIRVRGDRNNIVIRPVRETDKQRFREGYRAYKENLQGVINGTPLGEWPIATQSFVEEMKYLGFHTVEQIAEANDTVVSRVPGLQMLKNKARTFLEFSKGAAPLERVQKELEEQKSRAEMAERAAADMSARLADLEAKYHASLEAQVSGKKLPIPK